MLSWMVAVFIWIVFGMYLAGTIKMIMSGELEAVSRAVEYPATWAWAVALFRIALSVAGIFVGIWVAPL